GEPTFIIVQFDGPDDEMNPQNWSLTKKICTTLLALSSGIAGAWASGNDSTIIPQAKEAFGVSDVTESLSTGLYLVAFGLGALFSGPFSETIGRNPVYIITLVLFGICIMIAGLAPNIGVQLAFRFLAGWFGCTAITIFAGSVADLWPPTQRVLVLSLTCGLNFCAVFISPVVGAFIGQSSASWRWTEWISLIITGASTASIFFFAPETYGPQILSWKAAILRKETRNTHFRSNHELKLEPLSRRLYRSTWRPFDMLVHELSIVLFTIYLSVLYIVAFTFLTGYTYIFGDIYHMSQGAVGLCFLSLVVGIIVAGAISVPLHFHYNHNLRIAKSKGQSHLPAEDRLWFAIITAPCLPIALFWMAWTLYHSISFWSSLVASSLVGIAFLGIFIASYLYMIDTFDSFAGSALAIGAVIRYVAAGAMIPVSIPMYENLGVHWTLTLLGCISLILTPVPFVMWKFGYAIRKRSRAAS
ncbi:benomyl/methotrexate resistance protein, partial [Rhizodiscina lignyota]